MTVFAIVADAAGAHHANGVYSLWTTEALALLELGRLDRETIEPGWYGGEFHIVEVELDAASDQAIQADDAE